MSMHADRIRTSSALPSVALIAPTAIDQQMLGPGLRYWEFAKQLSRQQHVTLLTPNLDAPVAEAFDTVSYQEPGTMDRVLATHRIVVIQGYALRFVPELAQLLVKHANIVVFDLYTPLNLEGLEIHYGQPDAAEWNRVDVSVLLAQLQLGDYFICASERQRDYYLGMLAATGRLNPEIYRLDRDARKLIDIVPFGLPDNPPQPSAPRFKGVHPGIDSADRLLLWFGGMWNWLDPLGVVQAFAAIAPDYPTAKLLFVTKPPEPGASSGTAYESALGFARSRGLLDTRIFVSGTVPPDERGGLLCEADIGLSYHTDHLETRFAYRTRIVDYIWAGLPMIVASGDDLGDTIERDGLGFAAPPGNAEALETAMRAMLNEQNPRAARSPAFDAARQSHTWERAIRPLTAFCSAPRKAPDLEADDYLPPERSAVQLRAYIDQLKAEKARLAESAAHFESLARAYERGRIMRTIKLVKGLFQTARGASSDS